MKSKFSGKSSESKTTTPTWDVSPEQARHAPPFGPMAENMGLQESLGNRAVRHVLQPKLKINQPGDKYEREADRVADIVMRMSDSKMHGISRSPETVPRKCVACESGTEVCPKCAGEKEKIQRKPLAQSITPLVQRQVAEPNYEEEEYDEEPLFRKETKAHAPAVTPQLAENINAVRSSGQRLTESTRAFFEPRFGMDFSGVRVHSDGSAANTAKQINARAYTMGRDVVFGSGQYSPGTANGKKLLAHELTHVVQQASSFAMLQRKTVSKPEIVVPDFEEDKIATFDPASKGIYYQFQNEALRETIYQHDEGDKEANRNEALRDFLRYAKELGLRKRLQARLKLPIISTVLINKLKAKGIPGEVLYFLRSGAEIEVWDKMEFFVLFDKIVIETLRKLHSGNKQLLYTAYPDLDKFAEIIWEHLPKSYSVESQSLRKKASEEKFEVSLEDRVLTLLIGKKLNIRGMTKIFSPALVDKAKKLRETRQTERGKLREYRNNKFKVGRKQKSASSYLSTLKWYGKQISRLQMNISRHNRAKDIKKLNKFERIFKDMKSNYDGYLNLQKTVNDTIRRVERDLLNEVLPLVKQLSGSSDKIKLKKWDEKLWNLVRKKNKLSGVGTAIAWERKKFDEKLKNIEEHDDLLLEIKAHFDNDPDYRLYPLELRVMVIHLSGMRYKTASQAWKAPQELLKILKSKEIDAMTDEAIGKHTDFAAKQFDTRLNDKNLKLNRKERQRLRKLHKDTRAVYTFLEKNKSFKELIELEEKLQQQAFSQEERKNLNARAEKKKRGFSGRTLPKLRREYQEKRRLQLWAIREALKEYHGDRIAKLTDYQALGVLIAMKENMPDWVWHEIVRKTQLRLDPEFAKKNWEKNYASIRGYKNHPQRKYWEGILDRWKKGGHQWRDKKLFVDDPEFVAASIVCNEIGEHFQRLRGLNLKQDFGFGIEGKAKWYLSQRPKYRDAQKRPYGYGFDTYENYFKRPERASDFRYGASLFFMRFEPTRKKLKRFELRLDDTDHKDRTAIVPPEKWPMDKFEKKIGLNKTKPSNRSGIITPVGGLNIRAPAPGYKLGKNFQDGDTIYYGDYRWTYRKGPNDEYMLLQRDGAFGSNLNVVSIRIQWLRWYHEATVVRVMGDTVHTFETGKGARMRNRNDRKLNALIGKWNIFIGYARSTKRDETLSRRMLENVWPTHKTP